MAQRRNAGPPKTPIYRKWWFWVLIVVIILGAIGGSRTKDEVTAAEPTIPAMAEVPKNDTIEAPEETPEETPSAYSADSDSLSALLETVIDDPADVSVFKDDAGWNVYYTAAAGSFWDETDFIRKNLSAYIDFCRVAYEIDGIDSVLFYISTEMTDSRGNKNISSAFNIEMPKDAFSAYDWENMKNKSNSFEQIEADCSVFWINPGILSNAKTDKIYYA